MLCSVTLRTSDKKWNHRVSNKTKGHKVFNLLLRVSSSLPAFVVLIHNPEGMKLFFKKKECCATPIVFYKVLRLNTSVVGETHNDVVTSFKGFLLLKGYANAIEKKFRLKKT